MATRTPQRGRPPGLLINPDAVAILQGARSDRAVAQGAGVSTAHYSEMLAGRKGATAEVAQRLAVELGCGEHPGAVFPELTKFRTQIRHFVAPAADAEAVA